MESIKFIEDNIVIFRLPGDHRLSIVCSVVRNICNTLARMEVKFT
jgi:hypothetical protein